MTPTKSLKAAVILAACLLTALPSYSAEIILTSQGTGIINSPSIQKAEEAAKQDAYSKAITKHALKLVPQSSVYAVLNKLPGLITERGMQDATVIRLVSKNRQANVVYATYEFTMKDDFLKQWISANRFDIPAEFRPRIILAVTTNSPSEKNREWWNSTGNKKYSVFESRLATELSQWGENVFMEAPESRAAGADPIMIASLFKADLLVSGSIRIQSLGGSMNQCILKLNLVNVSSKSVIGSWNLSKKAEMPVNDMYGLVISSILDDLRQKIDQKITAVSTPAFVTAICIDNIRNHESYQRVYDALASTDGIMEIQISSIYGHSICHTAKIKGTLEDIMLSFKNKNLPGIDIQIKDDSARLIIE
ncbi:MAG TPA: hypothetical protein VIS94_17460 [Desulfomonilia bacterium]